MATTTTNSLLPSIEEQNSGSSSGLDIEPDNRWKNETRREIENGLRQMVDKARAEKDARLSRLPQDATVDREQVVQEYMDSMAHIRAIAEEQYQALLEREIQARKWATGVITEEELSPEILREQEALFAAAKRRGSTRQRSDSDAMDSVYDRVGESPVSSMQTDDRSYLTSDRSRNTYRDRSPAVPSSSGRGQASQPYSGITAYFNAGAQGSSPHSLGSDSDRDSISRKPSSASLSKAKVVQEIWRPSGSPDDRPNMSRTFAHAIATAEPPNGSGRRDGLPGDAPRGLSRSGSIRSQSGPPQGDADVVTHARRERVEIDAAEEQWAPMTKAKEKQREALNPQIKPRLSSNDFHAPRSEDRPQPPTSSAIWTVQPQTPDSPFALQSNAANGADYFPPAGDRAGVPIRTASRTSTAPQGSPEYARFQPPSITAHRPIVNKQSFNFDDDGRYTQPSPSPRAYYGPQGVPPAPSPSARKPIPNKRSFTIDDGGRQFQASPAARAWSGPESLPSTARRDSTGSRSLRSQSSRQDFYAPFNPRVLPSYREQSVEDSDEYESDWEDAGYGLGNLEERAEERRLIEEEERRLILERVRQEEEAKRMAAELKQKEAEARRREEEAQRKEAEAKKQAEEARRQAEEAARREQDAIRLQKEARKQAEEARRQAQEAKRREDEAKRKEEENRRKEAELSRKQEELRRREKQLKEEEAKLRAQEEELRRREKLSKQEEARAQQEAQRLEDLKRQNEQETARTKREEQRLEELKKQNDDEIAKARLEEQQLGELRRQEEEARLKAERDDLQAIEELRKRDDAAKFMSQEDFLKEQELLWRHHEERKRQDSVSSDHSRPAGSMQSSASSSTPRNIPGRSGSTSSSASGDRSSTTSSSFGSSSGFSYSGRSSTSTYTQASSAAPTNTPTPTPTPKQTTGGWKSSGPTAAATGSKKSPTSSTASGFTPQEEEEWKRRQSEHARKQQEKFQRMQELAEQERQTKNTKQLTKEEVIKIFEEHERRWTRLASMDVLSWYAFPWPMLKTPESPEDLTVFAIDAYVLSPHNPSDKAKSPKDRIKDHIKRWHPDRFETKLLPKVREDDREKVKEGAGVVARNLNELLTRQSNIPDFFA